MYRMMEVWLADSPTSSTHVGWLRVSRSFDSSKVPIDVRGQRYVNTGRRSYSTTGDRVTVVLVDAEEHALVKAMQTFVAVPEGMLTFVAVPEGMLT